MFFLYAEPCLATQQEQLCQQFGLQKLDQDQESDYLHLKQSGLYWIAEQGMNPIYIDFNAGHYDHRRRFGGGRGQTIAKAIGLKPGINNVSVIDATAGLGRDAFVLACLGCQVRMIERSAVIAALLHDALTRAAENPATSELIAENLSLSCGDSLSLVRQLSEQQPAQVIYLDPMYPHRQKSALVKKEMRLFRELVGDDLDAPALLQTALEAASCRVVVKRPKGADQLQGPKPSMALSSKQTRYDVYVKAALA